MKRFILFIAAAVMMLTGCSVDTQNTEKSGISVVATCFPAYDFARAVTGDGADVDMLICAGAEAHSYEPTPLDILKIQECDVFVYIGGESEVWADKILSSMDTSGITVVRLMDFSELLDEVEINGTSPDGQNEDDGEEYDEHIWTSPRNAIRCVEGIESAMCSVYPSDSDLYAENSEKYITQLESLDEDFTEMRKNAVRNNIIIGDRFPFRYLAADYDLEYSAAFSGCSSESEPGVYTMAYLINEILENDIDTVFGLEFSSSKLAEKLCTATGTNLLTLYSCDSISKEDFENGTTYIELMRRNLSNLEKALC
jgi:zinc transport system substrate-binding protein